MPEQKRTKWRVVEHLKYAAIHRFINDEETGPAELISSQPKANEIAKLLNSAYQTGREEMMAELAELFAQEGGQFYINQMLMAANGPSDPVIITRMMTERVDVAPVREEHEPSLGCCAEHFNASPGNPVSP